MKILGIDPGLAVTGFGVVEVDNRGAKLLNAGCFTTDSGEISGRLKLIFGNITDLVASEQPDEVAIEEGFYGKNVKVAMSLGQARGAVLLACSLKNVPVYEYSPREVKLSTVGRGSASKEQVNYMIKALLGLKEISGPNDVSDALAVAYCHYQRREKKY
jgi:crossover junction endodeoxyribonuclease RuvC